MTMATCLVLFVFLLSLLIFWCYQFCKLMLLSDADFPGKHDKILWFIAFCVLPIFTPFAFLSWNQAYLELRTIEKTKEKANGN